MFPSPKLGEGARRAGEVCINRLATTAEWQAVGIYRSWLVTPFEQKFCARSAHPTRPARIENARSLIGGAPDGEMREGVALHASDLRVLPMGEKWGITLLAP